MSDRGIRILVIDGEGSPSIGVVSPVRVLGEMMSRIAFDDDTTPESILPCDYFDLIVGSGDGGWLALMLGRLGMSAGRAKTIYEEIHTFVHRECASLDPTAKAEAFELRLKELICEETGQNDADLEKLQELKPTESRCNVAVLTKAALNIGAPILLRTYRVRDNQSENCPIWIAIRACTARPHIFPEANLSGQKLISASLGHNNPIESAIHEARVAFPMARIDCIISLGSGHPGHSELQSASVDSLAKAAIELSQGSEHVSQEFAKRQHAEGHGDIYFRFNVQQGLQAYAHAGYDSALAHTRAYLQDPAVGDALNAAISALRGKKQIEHPVTHPLQPTEHPTTEIIHASNAPPIQTYVHALYEEGLGLHKAKPVEVGDVGLLTKFGAFEILFNATLPAASQKTMGYRIPPGFEPIPVTSSDIKLEPQILSVPFLAHGDVIPSSQGLDSASPTHRPLQQPFNLSFAAMNGAALIIKDPPTEVALTPERSIEDYIRQNCRAWYHYYEHDPQGPRRNLHGRSLIFVTAVVQNSQWALGAWSSLGTPIEVSYSGSATIGDGKFIDISGRWAPPGRRDVKQGPMDARGSPEPKLRQQDDLDNRLAPLTQTLFIRGYVIGVRDTRPETLEPSKVYPLPYKSWRDFLLQLFSYGIPAVLRAAAEPRDLPPPPPPPTAPAVPVEERSGDEYLGEVETNEIGPDRQLRHPADDIMDNIFKIDSNLDIVVLHDNIILKLLRDTESLKEQESEEMHIQQDPQRPVETLDERDHATTLHLSKVPSELNEPPSKVKDKIEHYSAASMLPISSAVAGHVRPLTFDEMKQEPRLPRTDSDYSYQSRLIIPSHTGGSSESNDGSPFVAEEVGDSSASALKLRLPPEMLRGISIGFQSPSITDDLSLMTNPIPNVVSLPYSEPQPLHLKSPTWALLLRVLADSHLSRFEPSMEASAQIEKCQLRTVVQFVKSSPTSETWHTVLWFTIDQPVPAVHPDAEKYSSNDPSVLPFSYSLSTLPALLQEAGDNVYAIPKTELNSWPVLPITFPNVALYLLATFQESKTHEHDSTNALGKLARLITACYPSAKAGPPSVAEQEEPKGSLMRLSRKFGIGRGTKKSGTGRTPESQELITPFKSEEFS